MLRETVGLAHSCGIRRISIGLEDVTRADQDFALSMARMAKDLGAVRIRLADTLGVMTPDRIRELVRFSPTAWTWKSPSTATTISAWPRPTPSRPWPPERTGPMSRC